MCEHWIKWEVTSAYTPEQNGVAEHFWCTSISSVHICLTQAKLPLSFWKLAADYMVFTINCTTLAHFASVKQTGYQILYNYQPYLKEFHPFSCLVVVNISKELRTNKLVLNGWKGIFVGFSEDKQAYLIYDPLSQTVKESVHWDFFHNIFPGTFLIDEGESSRLYESLQDSYDDNNDSISDIGPAAPAPPPVLLLTLIQRMIVTILLFLLPLSHIPFLLHLLLHSLLVLFIVLNLLLSLEVDT
jgi:hypothetical protein